MRVVSVLAAGLFVAVGLDCGRARPLVDSATDIATEPAAAESPPGSQEEVDAPELVDAAFDDASPPPIAPATRYASLSPDECAAELVARDIAHERVAPRRGVSTPVRLRGPLSGVSFRTLWPEPERARTSFEIYDCRLVLALDDFAKLLRARGIVDVMHFSAYRPPPAGWSEPVGLRHEGGLAIDIGYLRKADGTPLNVEWDFAPRPRERICVPGAPPRDATRSAIELRKIACEAASAGLFHLTLTPAYDRVHRDHFHLEVTPGATDFVVR